MQRIPFVIVLARTVSLDALPLLESRCGQSRPPTLSVQYEVAVTWLLTGAYTVLNGYCAVELAVIFQPLSASGTR